MTLKAILFLGCDAQRAPNCAHRVDLGTVPVADLARATAGLREIARDQAWAHEVHGDRGLDVCSACTRFSWATGYAGIGPPPEPPVLPPEESWVSATDDWLRRQAAKREEQARREQAQHQPGSASGGPRAGARPSASGGHGDSPAVAAAADRGGERGP